MTDTVSSATVQALAHLPPEARQQLYRQLLTLSMTTCNDFIEEFSHVVTEGLASADDRLQLEKFIAVLQAHRVAMAPYQSKPTLSDQDMVEINEIALTHNGTIEEINTYFQSGLNEALG